MTAQHKSNIGYASFTCVVVDLLLCAASGRIVNLINENGVRHVYNV